MFTKRTLALACTACMAAFSAQAGIVNGSFEANAQAPGSWGIYSSLAGWQGGASGIELRNNVVGAAQEGNNFVELDTTANSSLWQTVLTSAGDGYLVSAWYSPRSGVNANSNGIEVWWDSTKLGTMNGSGVNASGNVWREYSYNVTGTGSNTLRFVAVGTSDALGGSLDNIRMSAVPEPGSLALVLGALAAGGLALRRRRG